jgi:hypothetical protein
MILLLAPGRAGDSSAHFLICPSPRPPLPQQKLEFLTVICVAAVLIVLAVIFLLHLYKFLLSFL